MKIILRHDSRDKQFHQHFGQLATADFPNEIDFDTAQFDDIQPLGDVKCTCYTTCDIAEDQENRTFDIQDLWNRIPQSAYGAEPRQVLGEVVKNGLLPQGQTERAKDWKSYWSAISGSRDSFDNLRSALMISQSPVGVAIYWCAEWLNTPALRVMPIGKTKLNGHMFSIEGWKQVNGEPMLIVEAWIGRKLYMPRSVFNKAMSDYGCGAWVLSTNEIDEKIRLNILEKIKDACINAIILLKQLLVIKTVDKPLSPEPQQVYNEVKESMKPNMIEKWAQLVERFEGAPKHLNNPGNFKYSPLIASWGGKKDKAGSDGGYFARFDTYEQGRQALVNFLTLGCKNELKSYKTPPKDHPNVNPRTIKGFTLVYTNFPAPKYDYSDNLIKGLGVSADTLISSFLS